MRIHTPPFGEPLFVSDTAKTDQILQLSMPQDAGDSQGSPTGTLEQLSLGESGTSVSPTLLPNLFQQATVRTKQSGSFMAPAPLLPAMAVARRAKKTDETKKKGFAAEKRDSDEDTELMKAVGRGSRDVDEVRKLLAAKADVNEQNKAGETALCTAVSAFERKDDKTFAIIDLLLKHKANVTLINEFGETVLQVAEQIVGLDPKIVELLKQDLPVQQASTHGAGSSIS
ncbi:MAG: ankyrin repeat domain-containing protein [Candidatus Babeliales bacterium]